MNNIQFTELKALAETIFNNYMSYQDVKSNWERAIYYNKLQNNFVNYGELYEVVTSAQLFNEDTKSVEYFNIKAVKQYTRKQWFIFLVGCDTCTQSLQDMREIMDNN